MINLFRRKTPKLHTEALYEKGVCNNFSTRPAPHTVHLYEDNILVNSFHFSYHSDRKEALRMAEYVLSLHNKKIDIQ